MFRPEMLLPMVHSPSRSFTLLYPPSPLSPPPPLSPLDPQGLPEDVRVIAWGLSLERPTMIKYGIDNIRDLVGHKVHFEILLLIILILLLRLILISLISLILIILITRWTSRWSPGTPSVGSRRPKLLCWTLNFANKLGLVSGPNHCILVPIPS